MNYMYIYILDFASAQLYKGNIEEDKSVEDYLNEHKFNQDEVHYMISQTELEIIDLD